MDTTWRVIAKTLIIALGIQAAAVTLFIAAPTTHAADPTCGYVPADHVVISEIQTGTTPNLSDEFIEIYNPTGAPVSLENKSLQYKSGLGEGVTVLVTFTATDVVPIHGYFLVGRNTYTGIGLTAANASYTRTELDATGGHIVLVDGTATLATLSDTSILDKVGYGSANSPEMTAAPAPAADGSIERNPGALNAAAGNGVDTGNNVDDFTVRAVSEPQNASSASEQPILDTTAPTMTNFVPGSESYINVFPAVISANVTDACTGIDTTSAKMWIDGQAVSAIVENGMVKYMAGTLEQGTHTVRAQVKDLAGNTSDVSWLFTFDSVKPSVSVTAPVKTNQLAVTATISGSDDPAGRSSGLSAMQVAFDGAFDTEAWEPVQTSITRNLMNKEDGQQAIIVRFRDRAGNISDTAQVLVTLERSPVSAPQMAISSTVGNSITLTWPAVAGAAGYIVRYSDGQIFYGPLTTTDTFITIGNLDPSKQYKFEVATISKVGSVTGFTGALPPEKQPVAIATTATTATKTQPEVTGTPEPVVVVEETPSFVATPTVSPSPTPTVAPSPTPSPEIKGGESDQSRDWTRVIVALSILIIAAGVATGGWYLYQWWTTRPTDKGKGKGGRW